MRQSLRERIQAHISSHLARYIYRVYQYIYSPLPVVPPRPWTSPRPPSPHLLCSSPPTPITMMMQTASSHSPIYYVGQPSVMRTPNTAWLKSRPSLVSVLKYISNQLGITHLLSKPLEHADTFPQIQTIRLVPPQIRFSLTPTLRRPHSRLYSPRSHQTTPGRPQTMERTRSDRIAGQRCVHIGGDAVQRYRQRFYKTSC